MEIQDGKGKAGVRSVGHTDSVGREGRGRGARAEEEAGKIAKKRVWRVSNEGVEREERGQEREERGHEQVLGHKAW